MASSGHKMEEGEGLGEPSRQSCNMNLTLQNTDCRESTSIMTNSKESLVRPNPLLLHLLKSAGAQKETFTMKEVIYHLGQYIMAKQLYDEKQQHIVHCSNDPLGELFGVQNFSVKEPRRLYAMISQNLVAADSQGSLGDTFHTKDSFTVSESQNSEQDSACELQEKSSPGLSSSSPKKSHSESEENSSNDQPTEQQRKRHKSDSISLTFDESLSWWVISGLRCDRNNSDSTDSSSDTEPVVHSDRSDWQDSDSDQFSVEFEVESVYSEDYSPSGDEQTVSEVDADDEVYQVTIYQAEDGNSFEEDTEISEADYWKCSDCGELNPPIPRYCHKCWALRKDWLPDEKDQESGSLKRKAMEDSQEDEGIDVPDGKRQKLDDSQELSTLDKKEDEGIQSSESQEIEDFSQPSTSGSMAPYRQEEPKPSEQEGAYEECPENSMPLSSIEPCVICQSRPKNGCIVHGRTGHLMACFSCAKKLKKRNKPCPVCRQPIQMIVLTYFS